MAQRSLRYRLLLGSILWTAGLLMIAHLVSIFIVHWYSHGQPIRVGRLTFRLSITSLIVVAIVCMAIGFAKVRGGLAAFDALRQRLSRVRAGRNRRIDGVYPTEVEPLVNDLNALLEHREQAVNRAMGKAGDLAHGLKTPLAVLAQEAEDAEAAGQHEIAAIIREQVEKMRRQIDYHLAHARAAASGSTLGTRSSVNESAAGIARALLRLYEERHLSIDRDIAPDHTVRAEREDLDEMLGNLLDNACKWAQSRIEVHSSRDDTAIVITVDDDGPGLASSMRESVLQRGVRADEAAPGSGLGLAIVSDLAALYEGSISLDASPAGGLRARLRLPSAD
jgi:signal transduction histidine kinase